MMSSFSSGSATVFIRSVLGLSAVELANSELAEFNSGDLHRVILLTLSQTTRTSEHTA